MSTYLVAIHALLISEIAQNNTSLVSNSQDLACREHIKKFVMLHK